MAWMFSVLDRTVCATPPGCETEQRGRYAVGYPLTRWRGGGDHRRRFRDLPCMGAERSQLAKWCRGVENECHGRQGHQDSLPGSLCPPPEGVSGERGRPLSLHAFLLRH